MKHTHKRILSIFAAAVLTVCSLPQNTPLPVQSVLTAGAEETVPLPTSGTYGENVNWKFDEETGTLNISGTGALDVSYKDYPWKPLIGSIKKIVIEDGITEIARQAFYEHSKLESVTIPGSVTKIGSYAFRFGLHLTDVELAEGITEIDFGAFQDCSALTNVTFPQSLTSIGSFSFQSCPKITSVSISENVTKIGNDAFACCEALEGITVNENNPNYCDVNGVLYTKDMTKVMQYPIGRPDTSYVIPDTVTAIDGYTFAHSVLTDITIPESVNKIGGFAFIESAWLKARQAKEKFIVVNNILIAGGDACTGDITIPDEVKIINDYALYRNENITSVIVPETVSAIQSGAFSDCSALESVTIENRDCEIQTYSDTIMQQTVIKGYKHSTAQQYADIFDRTFEPLDPDTPDVTTASYTEIPIMTVPVETSPVVTKTAVPVQTTMPPKTVPPVQTTMPAQTVTSPVYTATTAAAVTVTKPVTTAVSNTTESVVTTAAAEAEPTTGVCGENLSWTLEDGVLTISGEGEMADFSSEGVPWMELCDQIKKVIIEDGVTSIGIAAFYGCSGLADVTIPESVISIGGAAFYDTPWLAAQQEEDPLVICNHVVIDYAKCAGDVIIPDGICMISGGSYTNDQIPAITSVTIPRSVYQFDEGSIASRPTFGGIQHLVIKSYAESAAEAFAINHNITFEAIEEPVLVYQGLQYMIDDDEVIITGYTDDLPVVLEIPAEIDGKPVTGFAQFALANCGKLKEVTLPETITATGMQTFWNDMNLEKVTLPSGLKGLYEASFAQCTSLKSITIPDGCETIGNLVFSGCTALKEVNIPSSVKNFYEPAFADTPWLAAQQKKNPLVAVNDILIDASAASGEVTVPDGVKVINAFAFMDCDAITKITLPESVSQIDGIGSAALTDVTILNPDCVIKDDEGTICNGYDAEAGKAVYKFTIHGYSGSTAEAYAKKYDRKFQSLGDAPKPQIKGDYNGDGEVTVADAVLLARFVNEDSTLTAKQIAGILNHEPDYDGDELVTIMDVAAILNKPEST